MTNGSAVDNVLYDHVASVVLSARALVQKRVADGRSIRAYSDWPKLGSIGPGWPSISHSSFGGGPPDYAALFARTSSEFAPFGFDDVDGLDELFVLARGHERLRGFFGRPDAKPSDPVDDSFDIVFASQVFNLLDRAIHLFGLDFSDEDLAQPYAELERAWLSPQLPVEIWVPLALTRIAADDYDLDLGVAVRRIPDALQLSRVPSTIFGGAVHECVLDAATHALVLSGWKIESTNYWLRVDGDTLVRDPPELLTRFFTTLRLVGVDVGWAQIFLLPVAWALRWKAGLPAIATGGLARRYPPAWDDYGWLKQHDAIDEAMSSIVGSDIAGDLPRPLRIALKRLDAAMLRADEEDTIIDLLIALEAALGDRSPAEMTHKLSLRVAALLAKTNSRPPARTFRTMKKLYKYRSTIVHGGDTTKVRQFEDSDGETVPLSPLAAELAREVLLALVREPQWRDVTNIDDRLLLGSLDDSQADS